MSRFKHLIQPMSSTQDLQPKRKAPFFTPTVGNQSFFQRKPEQSFFHPATDGIQTKLTVGQPGDKYEQEADAVADQVVNQSNSGNADVQRAAVQDNPEGMKEDELVMGKLQRQAAAPEEEDPLATKLQRQEEMPAEEEAPAALTKLQRAEMVEEDKDPAMPKLQTKSQPHTASNGLTQQVKASKGKGKSLPTGVRSEMEGAMGQSFKGVRIHTDSESVQMNQELKAQAFTHGRDVYFNEGKYRPETSSGKHLLAHELTHVVQQRGDS